MRLAKAFVAAAMACMSYIVFTPSASASASAALIAYEGFDGASTGFATSFPTANSGNAGTATAFSLSYAGLETSGVARQGGEAPFLKAALPTTIASGEVWISWLYKSPAPAEDWTRLVTYNGTDSYGTAERWNLGNCFGSGLMVRSVGGGSSSAAVAVAPDTTYFVVVKFDFGAADSNNDGTITMWVNPTLDGLSPTGGTELLSTSTDDARMAFNGIAIAGGVLTQVDEIRVGNTWADVTPSPEPSSLACLSLGGLALLRRSRCRRL